MSARICTRSFASRFDSGSSIRKTLGSADDRAAHRDALTLAARQLAGLALEVVLEPEHPRHLAHPPLALGLLHLRDLQREADVLRDGQVRIERVVLEDHRDVAVLRRRRTVTSRSPMKIAPASTSSRPASMRSAVVLPEPDGPTRTMNSPSSTWRSSASTAGVSDPG